MSKDKNKILKAKVQALSNQLNADGKKFTIKSDLESKNITHFIKKDLTQTIILIIISFGILLLIKYLDSNFLFNKFL
jgi:hypothetical protein